MQETAVRSGEVATPETGFRHRGRTFEAYVPMTPEQAKANGSEYTSIEVSVTYRLGGHNFFSGNVEPRCYALAIHPVTRTSFGTSRVLLGRGFDNGVVVKIVETKAFSQKLLAKIAAKVSPERIAQLYIAGDKAAMQAELEAIRAGL